MRALLAGTARSVVWIALALATACGPPRDPNGTLERVRGGTLRVGVAENPPWTTVSGRGVSGVEPALVADFARELDARVEWVPGPQEALFEAAEQGELDLVIGGVVYRTPWTRRLSLAMPFYTDTFVVGLPSETLPRHEIRGVEVSVRIGDAVAAYLRRKGAVPVYTRDLTRVGGAVVAPSWQLARLGRRNSGVVVHQARHTMALPRGENGLLALLEKSLRRWRPQIPRMLREEAAR